MIIKKTERRRSKFEMIGTATEKIEFKKLKFDVGNFEMERSAREPDRIDFKRQGCCASDLSLLTYF